MTPISVEFNKLKRVHGLLMLTIVFFCLLLMLLYQKVINKHSGVYDANLMNRSNLCSFFFFVFCAFNYIWSIPFGSHLAAAEFTYNTWPINLRSSRYRMVVRSKIMVLLVTCGIMVALLAILGVVLTLPMQRVSSIAPSFWKLMVQSGLAVISSFFYTLVGFLLAFVFKSVSIGNLLGLGWVVSNQFLQTSLPWLKYISFDWYQSALVKHVFANLNHTSGLQLMSDNRFAHYLIISSMVVTYCIIFTVIQLIIKFRDV